MTYNYNTRKKRILRIIAPLLTLLVLMAVGRWWMNIPPDMSQPWTPPSPRGHNPAGGASLEILILESRDIARVRLLGVEEAVSHPGPDKPYAIRMKFRFEVIEWLRGGNNELIITGGVGMEHAQGRTLEEARWKAKYYFDKRDARFDDRDAVLFFQYASPREPNHYSIGGIGDGAVSPWENWWPSSDVGGVPGASGEQRFVSWGMVMLQHYQSFEDTIPRSATTSLKTIRRAMTLNSLGSKKMDELDRTVIGYAVMDSSPPAEMNLDYFAARSSARGSDNWVQLFWSRLETANSEVEGYRILRREQSDADFIELANVPANILTSPYEDRRGIRPETKYIYRLRAYGKDGDIADARVAITTVAALDPLDAATAAPAPN